MRKDFNSNHKAALQSERDEGIKSEQKTERWFLILLGGLFFIVGAGTLLFFLPDAIRDQEYGVLFSLLFVFAGAGFLYHAFKFHQAYRRFGPTPLFLDPLYPSVGGQLGGRFSIDVQNIINNVSSKKPHWATLACTRKSRTRKKDHTSYEVLWQDGGPVYLKQTARGVEASFMFDIPITCTATQDLNRHSSIEWKVTVKAGFSTLAQASLSVTGKLLSMKMQLWQVMN